MNEQLISILLDGQRIFNHTTLKGILENEKFFHFDEISKEELKKLGEYIKEESINYGPIYISIEDLSNNSDIYYYLGEGKGEKNIKYSEMKANVTRDCKHMSFYPLVQYAIGFKDKEYFERDDFLTVAGAFPIFVNDEMKYIIKTSGLHDGGDYIVVIKGLEKFLNKKIPLIENVF